MKQMFSRMERGFAKLRASGKASAIAMLVSGSAFAHAVTLLTMPINTRLYSPADFSALSVFTSIIGIIAPIACLRFDAAIITADSDDEAFDLLVLSVVCAVLFAILIWPIMIVFSGEMSVWMKTPLLSKYSWLIPLTIVISGVYLAAQAWCVRRSEFGAIAKSRAIQSSAAAATQIGLGLAGVGSLGLVLGHALNYGVGAFNLLSQSFRRQAANGLERSLKRLAITFQHFIRFPKYSVWEALANGASNSAPLLIVAAFSSGPEAGYLTLALFALQAPLALVGNAIGQVYLSGAPLALREGRLNRHTTETFNVLIKMGAGAMLFAAIVSPAAFGHVFGTEWKRSGILLSWMAPWFLLQFIASPISNALHVTGRQKLMMQFHLAGASLRVGTVLIAGIFANNYVSEVWAISGIVFYVAYLWLIFRTVGLSVSSIVVSLISARVQIIGGLVVGSILWAFLAAIS